MPLSIRTEDLCKVFKSAPPAATMAGAFSLSRAPARATGKKEKAVLVNPVVYSSEGLRSALVPQFPHLSIAAILGALAGFDQVFLTLGLCQFRRKAVH